MRAGTLTLFLGITSTTLESNPVSRSLLFNILVSAGLDCTALSHPWFNSSAYKTHALLAYSNTHDNNATAGITHYASPSTVRPIPKLPFFEWDLDREEAAQGERWLLCLYQLSRQLPEYSSHRNTPKDSANSCKALLLQCQAWAALHHLLRKHPSPRPCYSRNRRGSPSKCLSAPANRLLLYLHFAYEIC